MSVTVRLDTTKLNQLLAQMPERSEQIISGAALQVEGYAKNNIKNWPLVDTGALLNSIQAEKKSRAHWEIHDGVEYGVFWELGHRNLFKRRYMRMPFLGPALVRVEKDIAKMFAEGLFK